MINYFTSEQEEYVVNKIVASMATEPHRWKIRFESESEYKLIYRRRFCRTLGLDVRDNGVYIEMNWPTASSFRGESIIRLREAIERLRSLSDTPTPGFLSVLQVLGTSRPTG